MGFRWSSFSLCICILGLFSLACGCSESSDSTTTKQEIGLPTANNFRQVPATDFFFVLDLERNNGKAVLKHENSSLALDDVEKIAQLYQERKEQEGGHADVVIAAKADVPSDAVLQLVADLRSIGILQINFQVDPPEGSGKLPASALGLMVHQFPPLGVIESDNGLPDSSRLVVKALPEGDVAVDLDTFTTAALGGHLKRIYNNNSDPQLRVSMYSDPKTPFKELISTFDQVIISGFQQYDILSVSELKNLREP